MRKGLLVCIGLVVLLAGWRPAPKEPEGMALVRVLGVDGDRPVTLTAACGGEDQEKDKSRGQCTGESFGEALEQMPWSGREELSVTSVSYIIVGRDVKLGDVLLTALRNEELGASARVFLAEHGAGALLEACEDPASALELLERQGIEAPTVVKALAALYEGDGPRLPLLLEGGEKGIMVIDWMEWRGPDEQQ